MSNLLDSIDSPIDLKKLPVELLPQLAMEIREFLISTLSHTGGHLGGNLGVVELSLALHYVFDSPTDKIVWDVAHQCYVHKMLTGRRKEMPTIRQYQGLSGFTRTTESEHDSYGAGHASTSISASYGLTVGRDLAGEDHQVVAVIGDGAMTGGMAYEGLNNLGSSQRNMIVILNDNSMSISPSVGAIHEYLAGLLTDQTYNKMKSLIWDLAGKVKGGSQFRDAVSRVDQSIKNVLVPGVFFEKLGIRYFGPIDGHDISGLIRILSQLKSLSGPRLLHIRTVKGKGYRPAEEDDCRLHGIGSFDKITGKPASSGAIAYTRAFGETLVDLAQQDDKIVAVTAAMRNGTGLDKFARTLPDRFFDVGIAEQHAAVFAGGLACKGRKPVLAVYSTFLQRAFDPIIHDLALQRLGVLLAIDRAGLVGDDGPTHHGCFDISYLRPVPNLQICAPRDGTELTQLLRLALANLTGLTAIRFPRADIPEGKLQERDDLAWGSWEYLREGRDGAILGVGSMVDSSLKAATLLAEKGVDVAVINCRFIKPFDQAMLVDIVDKHMKLITVEEGSLIGGFGSGINDWLADTGRSNIRLHRLGIPDQFVEHGHRDILLKLISLHPEGIADAVEGFLAAEGKRSLTIKKSGTSRLRSDVIKMTARGRK